MPLFTLRNDFHNSTTTIRCEGKLIGDDEIELQLSKGQIRKAKSDLCGTDGCTCSNAAGMRGENRTDDGRRITFNMDATI